MASAGRTERSTTHGRGILSQPAVPLIEFAPDGHDRLSDGAISAFARLLIEASEETNVAAPSGIYPEGKKKAS